MNRLLNSRTTALISKHAQYNITNAEATVSNHIYKYCKRMYATATKKPTPKLLILMGPPVRTEKYFNKCREQERAHKLDF
jgi:hypothetical protein